VRVVSLVPSSTETLLALGVELVACTRFCEQPGRPQVGGTKNPDIDAIVDLAPDLVVMDREENRVEDHDSLVLRGVPVWASDVRSVDDAMAVVAALAERTGRPAPAVSLPTVPAPPTRRTAFVPIWRRPWMTIGPGTYGASLLAYLGVDLATADIAGAYPTVELDDLAARSPDLVLVPSEPYAFSEAHLDELRAAMGQAVVRRIDGQDLFWWGIRTPGAIRRLGAVIAAS
jgi:ABC-type Fe3+-hydroxamate transport system substrate-binding protein